MVIEAVDIQNAFRRVAAALRTNSDYLTELDQAVGDGDLGITASKVADALETYAEQDAGDDLGKYLAAGGMAVNRAASSTLGTLLASGLMSAGKTARGQESLSSEDVAGLLEVAFEGLKTRGKAKLGDKTILDALNPASEAFRHAITEGHDIAAAGQAMLAASVSGRDVVTPLRNRVGRAGWVGERTEGKVDPGCEMWVVIARAIVQPDQ
jgi:dihydroxyacetone kinase